MPLVRETSFDDIRASFANIGVRQLGDPVLRAKCRPIELPTDVSLAKEIIDCLIATMKAARHLHEFSRGIGLAAPQIGFSRRIAVIQPVGGLPVRMINPRVVWMSQETSVGLEGCLSFFDYRGEVQRAVAASIEFEDLAANTQRVDLQGDAARLALHEIDHLDGRLYIDLMGPGDELVNSDGSQP